MLHPNRFLWFYTVCLCVSNCLHEYLQHVWLSFFVCSPESWVRSHGAAAERHTPDDPWSRQSWVGSDPLGYKRPLPAGMTGEPLALHSVRGKPKSMEDTHLFCLIVIDMAETVRSWQTLELTARWSGLTGAWISESLRKSVPDVSINWNRERCFEYISFQIHVNTHGKSLPQADNKPQSHSSMFFSFKRQ